MGKDKVVLALWQGYGVKAQCFYVDSSGTVFGYSTLGIIHYFLVVSTQVLQLQNTVAFVWTSVLWQRIAWHKAKCSEMLYFMQFYNLLNSPYLTSIF